MASTAVLALCSVASPALAANYPTSAYYRPFVEAGPGGHAVAVAGFDTPGAAFAPPGGAFGAASGSAPSGPDALALDAIGTATALDSNGKEVQAFVAPPGAPFGSPMSLGPFNGSQSLLAVDPGGAAAAAWSQEGRLRVAVRLAGRPFAQAVDAGAATRVAGIAITSDGTVQALVSRPRVPTPSMSSPTDAVLVTIRPGAVGPEAVKLAGEEGLALARSADGQLLAIMRAVVDSAVQLVSQRLDVTGRPTSAVRPVAGPGSGYVDVLGAVLEPDGRAVVAWTLPDDRRLPSRVLVAEGNATTGFAAPRRLDREGELAGAQLAANARGDTAIVWSAGGYRPRAALRPAGGTFGAPLVVSARAGHPPTAGVLPDGQAVVGWTEDDGLLSRQVVARVTSAGAGPPQVLAERALRLRPRQRARCRAARRSVLARNRFAVHRRVGRNRREICSLITGITTPVFEGQFGDFLDTVRLAGPLVARATVTGDDVGPSPYAEAAVVVGDTRTGRSPGPLGIELGENVAVGDLALAADGAYAVTVCSTGADLYYVSRPTRLARRLCSRPGRRVQVIAVDGVGPGRERVVGQGRTIDPRSLRLRGRRVTWRQNGRTRSATLRQVQLPG